jgi:hypothetical protein
VSYSYMLISNVWVDLQGLTPWLLSSRYSQLDATEPDMGARISSKPFSIGSVELLPAEVPTSQGDTLDRGTEMFDNNHGSDSEYGE